MAQSHARFTSETPSADTDCGRHMIQKSLLPNNLTMGQSWLSCEGFRNVESDESANELGYLADGLSTDHVRLGTFGSSIQLTLSLVATSQLTFCAEQNLRLIEPYHAAI
jgi:hypothetical protein